MLGHWHRRTWHQDRGLSQSTLDREKPAAPAGGEQGLKLEKEDAQSPARRAPRRLVGINKENLKAAAPPSLRRPDAARVSSGRTQAAGPPSLVAMGAGRGAARAGAWRPRAVAERAGRGRAGRGRAAAEACGAVTRRTRAGGGRRRRRGARRQIGAAPAAGPPSRRRPPARGPRGPVIMSLRQRLVQLVGSLQDPQKVARFQRLCGVEAPVSRTATAAADPREDEKAEAPLAGESRRQERQLGASRGPPPPGSDRNQCPGKPGGGGAPNGVRNGRATELGPASQRRAGVLRRNSLTGEEGQLAHVSNMPLYYLFCFGTELGNELFYILFFPFWIWNLDALVGRRLVVIWVLAMYLGQCTKDIIRWPRPASPPVVKLEVFYNSEYSMPSTHAMSGTAIPISMILLTYGRWQVRVPVLARLSLGELKDSEPLLLSAVI